MARYERAQRCSQVSKQVHRAVELERKTNLARRQALSEAFKHDHGLYCKNKSPPPQVQPGLDDDMDENDNLANSNSSANQHSPSPTVPAEVG